MTDRCAYCAHGGLHTYQGLLLCGRHLSTVLDAEGWTGHREDPPTFPAAANVVPDPMKWRKEGNYGLTPWRDGIL